MPWSSSSQTLPLPVPAPAYKFFPAESSWCPPQEMANNQVLQGLRISSEDAAALEQNTRQQSQSTTWRNSRANRLTASKFGTVLSRKAPWTERGIANVMRPKEFSNGIVRYGTLNEPRAVQRYVQSMDHIGRKVIVHTCGLMVRPASPWLGATPDRVVYDVHEDPPFGLIEVKCPWSKRSSSLQEALASPDFFVEVVNGIPHLKESSDYYAQVMGQMFCAGLLWTHFIVYADAWMIVCRVEFCCDTWAAIRSKLDNFYFEQALPYLSSLEQT
ncbi:uncharacterized protein LOC119390469 [Rhipicephalus sanguineus]|nr:uncharacterized protein LOC119390469 [Rhipicephalus sanguineus]